MKLKTMFKKNQLMITALALMVAIAGYLQYTNAGVVADDYLPVSGTGIIDETTLDTTETQLDGLLETVTDGTFEEMTLDEIESLDSDGTILVEDYIDSSLQMTTPETNEVPGEAIFTSGDVTTSLSEVKLLKEQVRAKNKETLLEIINSETLSDAQKQSATDSLIELTYIAELEMSAEILLEAKGFTDVVVSNSGTSVDVVVNVASLSDVDRAQIEDIIMRKTGVGAENIIISTVVQ